MQKVEIYVEIPDGYEATGEYRPPNDGETFLSHAGSVVVAKGDWSRENRLILRRVVRYREPVLPADCGKRAEFSRDGVSWTGLCLDGYSRTEWIAGD